MRKLFLIILPLGVMLTSNAQESKVSIIGDAVIAKDTAVSSSRGNLEIEGSLTVGKGAVKIESNGDVVITGRVIIKNPDAGISMGAYGRPSEDVAQPSAE